MKRLNCNFSYDVKSVEEEGKKKTVIKGFANRAMIDGKKVIDRGLEFIPPEEWKLENYMHNPIILFNHDKNMPVGRATKIIPKPEGLYIEAELSNSNVPEIKKVRDLVEEKILRSLSVGIDVEQEEESEDSYHLKGVELLENSIVSIPMNQRSQFEVSVKMLKDLSTSRIKEKITKEKGANLASSIHRRISEMQESSDDFSRENVLNKIAADAKMSLDDLFEFMAGNVPVATEELIDSLSMNLGMNPVEMNELNTIDESNDNTKLQRPDPQDGDADEQNDEEQNLEAQNEEIIVDESDLLIEEDEQEPVEEDKEETETEEMLEGDDPETEELEEDEEDKIKAYSDCVSRAIAEHMQAGKPQDQAIAIALNECQSKKTCSLGPKHWKSILEQTITQPMQPQGYVESSPGNESLHEMRQTNVLLAQLIGEIQSLKQIFAGAMMATPQAMTAQAMRLNKDPDNKKDENLDILDDYHRKLNQRLEKLNV